MITEEQYGAALKKKAEAEKVIKLFFMEKRNKFDERMKNNPIFKDDELIYSELTLCHCGHGLAYPKDCGFHHYWDCSAILKGEADKSVKHVDKLPFIYAHISSETQSPENPHKGTTRGVFKPNVNN